MTRVPLGLRSETFGLDTEEPWAIDALRLLFAGPRIYQPLVDAWDNRFNGTTEALARLVEPGFVAYQPPVIVDTVSGTVASKSGRSVRRYRITAAGRRLRAAATAGDALASFAPRTSSANRDMLRRILDAADSDAARNSNGVSFSYLHAAGGGAERSARWWVRRLVDGGYLRVLDVQVPDVRAVVPGHFRITRMLTNQMKVVINTQPVSPAVHAKVRDMAINRRKFLSDIVVGRVSVAGATDYDHDVEAQEVLATFCSSQRAHFEGRFRIEPRYHLPAVAVDGENTTTHTTAETLRFQTDGDIDVFYQPDAEYREHGEMVARRGILEYERFQTRRNGWEHLERFIGYLNMKALPFEEAVLRFVVASEPRARSYTELIEAYVDWLIDHPELRPVQRAVVAVAAMEQIEGLADPLADAWWYRIALPTRSGDVEPEAVLHTGEGGPYEDYFGLRP